MELIEVSSSSDTESEVVVVDGAAGINEEGSGDDDRPYTIERSPTGRATCRRCDRVISKNSLRVSHVPLFRGKPGYRVYRHLECAVFGDDVTCVQDVAGWESLDAADVELLRQRVIASQRELEEENREIQPDELVQLAFDGPIRPPPPGLWASLLPFQVEGVSWMHAQEQTEVRGGILADEMGL
jgi:DNA repair protein RAD16